MNDWVWTLVILVVYLLFGALGKKKQPKRKPVALPAEPIPGAGSGFEDTLRELRNALGMDGPPAKEVKMPAPELVRSRMRSHGPSLADTAPKKSWSSEFIEHAPNYADARFEESPRRMPFVSSPTVSRKQEMAPPQQRVPASDLQLQLRELRNSDAARKAFVMSEIFGAPLAMRRR